jgi:hypothetical protein
MKIYRLYIISILLLIGLSWSSLQGQQLTRQERKEIKKSAMAANYQILDSLLSERSFVLEADFLADKYGYRVPVNSMLNFIKVDGSMGVLQTGSDFARGSNSVGGATAEGKIGGWDIKKDPKNLRYSVKFNLVSNIGSYNILLTVSSDNNASATITGTTPGKLIWQGHLTTINNSRVFKGINSTY